MQVGDGGAVPTIDPTIEALVALLAGAQPSTPAPVSRPLDSILRLLASLKAMFPGGAASASSASAMAGDGGASGNTASSDSAANHMAASQAQPPQADEAELTLRLSLLRPGPGGADGEVRGPGGTGESASEADRERLPSSWLPLTSGTGRWRAGQGDGGEDPFGPIIRQVLDRLGISRAQLVLLMVLVPLALTIALALVANTLDG